MEKRNSHLEHPQPRLLLHMQLRCGSLSITTPVSHLANEFDVRSELHGQVSCAAVNQILCHSVTLAQKVNNSKISQNHFFAFFNAQ